MGVPLVSTEAMETLPPQDIPLFRDPNEIRKNICWHCQPSGEISTLTCTFGPPGVKSLSLNSAVRRSTNTGNSGADPNAVDNRADADAVVGRGDTEIVDANSFQKYCIEGIVAVLGSMLLGMVLCCVLHVWRKRRK